MKSIIPILICSAITGGLGYYFGHITKSQTSEATTQTASSAPAAYAPAPAPVAPAPTFEDPAPVAPAPAPVATQPLAVASTPEPSPEESAMAARAAQTIQTLTDTQGRTIQAEIVEVMASNVKIRRTDGLETTIPLNMLSEKDVVFCNYLREQAKEEEVASPTNNEGFDWDAYFNS